MRVDPIATETDGQICDLLIKRIGRPKNLIMCKAINLWDNRYRINVYTKYMVDPDTGLEGQKIAYSCFAKLDDKNQKLDVISESSILRI
jgi:hypothetical protein|tara:strand:+ start:1290 stop:1556 length:267 start_codon:yes stop_codon:yes gene_type:complete